MANRTRIIIGWAAGLLDATQQHLSAKAERLRMENIELEREREDLAAQIEEKNAELNRIRADFAPFKEEEAAVRALLEFEERKIAVRFSATADLDAFNVSLSDWSEPFNIFPSTHKNPAIRAALEEVNNIRNVHAIRVSHIELSADHIRVATKKHAIEELALYECKITRDALAGLESAEHVKVLRLGGNDVDSFSMCPRLLEVTSLDLGRNPIGDEGVQSLVEAFPNLVSIDLSDTKITDRGLASLSELEHLSNVYVYGTDCTGQGVVSLLSCPKLRSVAIDEGNVTDAQRAVVKEREVRLQHERSRNPYYWGDRW